MQDIKSILSPVTFISKTQLLKFIELLMYLVYKYN